MAEHEAKILVRNLLFPGSQAIPYDVVPWSTFTDPELARVGLTEQEARDEHGIRASGSCVTRSGRTIGRSSRARPSGLVKVIVGAGLRGTVLGAHILGPHAGEMIHEWVLAMRHSLPRA
jgi:pyruvate/2-oxoglutarate dehydrogenase complex dihydrolipoamide dehydrogenase (E3) component